MQLKCKSHSDRLISLCQMWESHITSLALVDCGGSNPVLRPRPYSPGRGRAAGCLLLLSSSRGSNFQLPRLQSESKTGRQARRAAPFHRAEVRRTISRWSSCCITSRWRLPPPGQWLKNWPNHGGDTVCTDVNKIPSKRTISGDENCQSSPPSIISSSSTWAHKLLFLPRLFKNQIKEHWVGALKSQWLDVPRFPPVNETEGIN